MDTIVQCNVVGHKNQHIVAVCISKTCQKQRTCCSSCMLKEHKSHEIIDLDDLIEKKQNNQNSELLKLYQTLENIIKQGLEQLRQQIKSISNPIFPEIINLTTLNEYGNYLAHFSQDNQNISQVKAKLELSTKIFQQQFAQFSQKQKPKFYYLQEQIILYNMATDVVNLLNASKINEALEMADQILQKYPENEAGWYYKAKLLFQSNKNKDVLEEALSLNSISLSIQESHDSRKLQGQILQQLKQYNEALEQFDRAILLKNNDEYSFYNRGQVYQALGMIDKAKLDYQKALEIDPNYQNAQNHLDRLSK